MNKNYEDVMELFDTISNTISTFCDGKDCIDCDVCSKGEKDYLGEIIDIIDEGRDYFTSITENGIEIGDGVHILNPGEIYDVYKDWAIEHLDLDQQLIWNYGCVTECCDDGVYRVLAKAPHLKDNDAMLYFVVDDKGRGFIIDEAGIEKVRGYKK